MNLSNVHPRKIFLVDGIGAVFTSSFMFLLLVPLREWIGLSSQQLQIFGGIALLCGSYSFFMFFFIRTLKPSNLHVISILNISYVLYTMLVLVSQFQKVTVWGWGYFLVEIAIILVLVRMEWQAANRLNGTG